MAPRSFPFRQRWTAATIFGVLRLAYLFERFPSFGQTFCYREVSELVRQDADVTVFSIRRPTGEPHQDWDAKIVSRVIYLPDETELIDEIDRAIGRGELPKEAVYAIKQWGRQSDFLRLYQAASMGLRLREDGIERVHAHFAGMAARTAYWLKQFFGIDYSLTVHANDIFAPRDFVVSLSKLFESASAIVTVSDFALERLKAQFPQDAHKFHRVYNGVDAAQFKPAEFQNDMPVILSIGRLIEKKGFNDLVAACEILRSHGRKFRCEIIGEGPLEESLREQIVSAQLSDRVQLLSPKTQSEIAQHLEAGTLFVLPCRPAPNGDMDNLPTVIMEAMAAGLPVVSTSLAGISEMVQMGVSGDLVSPNDSSALAKAMEGFLFDRDRAQKCGARGREIAAERFSIADNVAILARILVCE